MNFSTLKVRSGNHPTLKLLLPMMLFFIGLGSFQAMGQTQLAAWSFPTISAAPNTPTSFVSEFGTQINVATLYADGTNGSSTFDQSGGNPELTMFAGNTTNDPKASPSNTGSITAANASANGKSFVIKYSMTGYEDPVLTYATRGTSTGFSTQEWSYSTDGVNFIFVETKTGRNVTTWSLQTVDLSIFNDLDNATEVYLKITFDGATNTSGNNRLDNIQIHATAASFPPVVTESNFNGTVGISASFQVLASESPDSYALSSGTLPGGLSLNTTTGEISGTPTEAGSFVVDVTATNNAGTSAPASIQIDIAKGSQTITFDALANKVVGDPDFNLTATASSGLSVSYSSSNTDVATVSGNTVHIVGAGTTTITASQAGDANYDAADPVDQDLTVTSAALEDQTITFGPLSNVTYGDADFNLTATASSGLTVTYSSSNTDVATVSGNTVTIVGVGTTTITASQDGDQDYNPADPVDQDLTVDTKELTITGATVDTKHYDGNTDATLSGATLVGVVSGDDVFIDGNTGTFADANAGSGIAVTTDFTIGGADIANYSLTQPSGLTGEITKAEQTITFNGPLSDKMIGEPDFNLVATASSGLPVTFSSTNTSVATVTPEGLVSIVAIGTTDFIASQSGDGNYNAATDVQWEQTIIPLAPVSIWTNPITGSNPNTQNPYTTGQTVETGITVSGISRGSGINGTNASNRYNANGWNSASLDPDKYFEFTLTPDAGNAINFNSFEFTSQVSQTNKVSSFAVRTSLDNFTSDIANQDENGATISLTGSQYQGVVSAITFRVYGWGTTSATSTYSINDFTFTGNVVTAPPPVPIVSVTVTDRSACGGFDGAITANVTNGTEPYTYSWTGLSGSGAGTPFSAGNVSSITDLNYGFYNLTVTDANSQVVTVNGIHVKKAFLPVITHNGEASSSCGNTGTLIIYAAAGVAPYTYSVDGVNYQASNLFTGLAAGPMTIYVKDAGGCVGTKDYTIQSVPALGLNTYAYPASSCNNDGQIQIFRTGGVPPYTYSLDGVNYQSSNLFTGLAGNQNYTAYIRDANGCDASTQVMVPQGAGLSVVAHHSNTAACINNGSIQIQVSGGYYPYQYSIDNGVNYQGSNVFEDLPSGNYTVTVLDAKGCTGTANVTINIDYITLTTEVINATDCGSGNGKVLCFVSGGTGPYTYSIDGDTYQGSNIFADLAPGYYTLYAKDANTCIGQLIDVLVGPEECARTMYTRQMTPSKANVLVKAFPNPSSNEFTISMSGFNRDQKVQVSVTDVLGRRVAQFETMANGQIRLGKQLHRGMYHVQLIQGTLRENVTVVKE